MAVGRRASPARNYRACLAVASAVIAAQVCVPVGAQSLRSGAPNFPSISSSSGYGRQDDGGSAGRPFTVIPALSGQLMFSDNINLTPDEIKESDWVLSLTPSVAIDGATARTLVRGNLALPIRAYARTEGESVVSPVGTLYGRGEVIDGWFFVEGEARFQQSYLSPFGAVSEDSANNNANRYSSYTYRVSPYVHDTIGGTLRYLIRNDNIWTNVNNSSFENRRFYTNRITGTVDRLPTPIGWGIDYVRNDYDVESQALDQTNELARARLVYRPDPDLQLQASVGYERNKLLFSDNSGSTWGAGFEWRPSPRTRVSAVYEHRFFGASYQFDAQHRTPLTVWSLRASRYITSYPEQIATLETGGDVVSLLDTVLTSRIPDAAERQQFVANYVTSHGLPLILTEPLPIVSERLYLRETASATAGLLGARSGLFATIYRSKTEPITGSGASIPSIFDQTDNTQLGVDVRYTYNLLSNLAFTAAAGLAQTESNEADGLKADRWNANATLTRRLSGRTSTFVTARYQKLDSLPELSFRETAFFVGFNHSFR